MTFAEATELAEDLLSLWPNPRPANSIEYDAAKRAWAKQFRRFPFDVGTNALAHLAKKSKKRPTPADLDQAAMAAHRKLHPHQPRREPVAEERQELPPAERVSDIVSGLKEKLAGAKPNVVIGGDPAAHKDPEAIADYVDPYGDEAQ